MYHELAIAYAEFIWRDDPMVSYPLQIDIKLGNMKFYFFKHGMKGVRNRIDKYNKVLISRVHKNSDDIDTTQFYIQSIFTDKRSIENQLDNEAEHLHMH